MSGKHPATPSAADICTTDNKKAKIGSPSLKAYPKRNRTPSAKACEIHQANTSFNAAAATASENIPTTVSADKIDDDEKPSPAVLSPIQISLLPKNMTINIDDYDKEDDNGEDFITFVKNSRKKAATKKSTTATPKAKIPKTAGASTSKAKTSSTKALKTNNENNKPKRCMPKTVDKKLEEMGYNAASVSFCLKAGICKGFYKLTEPSDLEAVIIEGEHDCHTFKVKLKDLIYQPDSGDDYEDGSEAATALCNCCKEDEDDYWPGKAYVTGLCTGKPDFDCGKFHNHCRECKKGFGVCLRDYRMAHCDRCNKHWFTGLTGFPCDNCKRIKQQARGIAGLFMRDSDDDSQGSDDSYGGPTNGCSIS